MSRAVPHNRIHTRAARACAAVRHLAKFIRHATLTRADAEEVWAEMARILGFSLHLFALLGASSAVLIGLNFRAMLDLPAALACAAIPATYLALIANVQVWARGGDHRAFVRRSEALLFLLGVGWGLLIFLLAGTAQGHQQNLLAGVIIAVVSTPAMTSPLSAALAFGAPSALLNFLSLAVRLRPFNPYMLLCYLGYLQFVLAGVVLLNRSLLDRSRSRVQLQAQNRTIRVFLKDYEENASDWLWETDERLRLTHISPRLAKLVQRPVEAMLGMPLVALLEPPAGSASGASPILSLLSDRASFRDLELLVEAGGRGQHWLLTGRPTYDEAARFRGYRGVGTDVTEVRRSEQQARYLATHDGLTGLFNRQHFMERLRAVVAGDAGEDASATTGAALLLLDLDRFKEVNDRFGHAAGDALLVAVSERLRGCVREGDFVARLGGDEFAVLAHVSERAELAALARRIVGKISRDYMTEGVRARIGVSVGVCFPMERGTDLAALLHNADLAMYQAKAEGRSTWRLYRPELRVAHDEVISLQADLAAAIEREELRLEYQPIFDLRTLELVSVEALLRWRRGGEVDVSPARFIPLAEQSGLISRIGEYVLRKACASAARWPREVALSVNVSPAQLGNPDFVARIDGALIQSGLSPRRLQLEITESAFMEGHERTFKILRALRERGVRLALDDFGTGYSSLAYLTTFRFDDLKIDASFVKELDRRPEKQAVIRAVAQLAADLLIPVTAEGVERPGQAEWLKGRGIQKVQGFLFAKPLPEDALLDRLRCRPSMPAVA